MADKKCYMIVFADFTDREKFMATYAKVVPGLVEKFGGRYVLMGGGGETLEGKWGPAPSAIISEWPDRAAAKKFWNSPEYAEAKKLREGTGTFLAVLMDAPQINR